MFHNLITQHIHKTSFLPKFKQTFRRQTFAMLRILKKTFWAPVAILMEEFQNPLSQ